SGNVWLSPAGIASPLAILVTKSRSGSRRLHGTSSWIRHCPERDLNSLKFERKVYLPSISMKELLEAGVHFRHQTKRWNPKMKEYIFGERNGIYIIDLQKTLKLFKDAMRFVGEMAAQGKSVLFVGTKRQAQEAVAEEATRCSQYYVNQRWLGGLLTNMSTVQRSIKRLKELEAMATEGNWEGRAKKEVVRLERERKHLNQNLAG